MFFRATFQSKYNQSNYYLKALACLPVRQLVLIWFHKETFEFVIYVFSFLDLRAQTTIILSFNKSVFMRYLVTDDDICTCDNNDGQLGKRWLGLSLLAVLVPCLCLYPLLTACHTCGRMCRVCGARHVAS